MKTSIVMTVYDRPIEVLLRTLRGLYECGLKDSEVVVVNDGSHLPYKSVRAYVEEQLDGIWFDMPEYECFHLEDGSNNPARAFNQAVSLCTGENLIVMSSDVLVPPLTMRKAAAFDFAEAVWTPYIEDTWGLLGDRYNAAGNGREYCGPNRLFPMPWFLGMSRQHLLDVGGWDESYLGGVSYEDNDVVGRLVLRTGRFLGDWSVKAYHQGHPQIAYRQDSPDIVQANLRNRELTMEKWNGIPFDREYTPFDVTRKMQRNGLAAHECIAKPGKLDEMVAKTTGLLQVGVAARQ